MLDPVLLSRVQFVWVVALHILLPAFTVGLSAFIAVLEGLHLATGKPVYVRLSEYWTRIFAVSFGMGVVSGIVMPFQFGTNWSAFTTAAGDIMGPLLSYEGLTAFFLEAGFLGVLLFGRKLVPPLAHFFAALMVAAGTLFSSFWILAANSWMQTPAGYQVIDGRYVPADWVAVIFNPSFPYRLAHTVVAFFVTTGFVVLGVSAYHLRASRYPEGARIAFSMTFVVLTFLVPLQIYLGDAHGLNTLAYQPMKLASIEARWETGRRVPLTLFAWPNVRAERNDYAIDIPWVGSLILTHQLDGEVKGLKEVPPADRPYVPLPFFAFRIMVGLGLIMLGVVAASWWLRRGGRLYDSPWFLRLCMIVAPIGFVAVIAGWVVTETGRQPWVIYGLLRTSEAVSPSLTGADVLASLLVYVVAYVVVFGTGLVLMLRLIRAGPTVAPSPPEFDLAGRPARPLSAATRSPELAGDGGVGASRRPTAKGAE